MKLFNFLVIAWVAIGMAEFNAQEMNYKIVDKDSVYTAAESAFLSWNDQAEYRNCILAIEAGLRPLGSVATSNDDTRKVDFAIGVSPNPNNIITVVYFGWRREKQMPLISKLSEILESIPDGGRIFLDASFGQGRYLYAFIDKDEILIAIKNTEDLEKIGIQEVKRED